MYILCDVATRYVLYLEVLRKSGPQNFYSGKNIIERAIDGARISPGHALICDRFYTSVELAKLLFERGVTLTETCIQRRRFIPDMMKNAALRHDDEMGEMVTKQVFSESLSLIAYIPRRHFTHNFKAVLLLSTEFQLHQQVIM